MKVESKIVASFGLAFLAVLLVGALTYSNNHALLQRNAGVIHTYKVLEIISELLDAAQDVETGARGFLLTGRDDYLEPFHTGRASISSKLVELRGRLTDNPAQLANLHRLGELLQRKVDISEEYISIRREAGLAVVLTQLQGRGKQAMDEVRQQIFVMRKIELALLDQRNRESAASARNVNVAFFALMTVAILLLLIFFFQVRGDLAERQRMVSLLVTNEQQFRGVLESAPDALVLSDQADRITLVNPAFERLFGVPQHEAVGRSLSDFLRHRDEPNSGLPDSSSADGAAGPPPPDASDPLNRLAPKLEGAIVATRKSSDALQGVREREAGLPPLLYAGIRAGSGAPFPAEISQSVLKASGTEDPATITAIRDRTEREQAERNLRGFTEELARSNAELERFAYVASHDLQEPLRMVSSYTQLLRRRYRDRLDESANEYIDFAVDGANRMQKLIQDLLAYSRIGSRPIEQVPVDCEGILARVLRDMQETLHDRGARVEAGPLPLVQGDAGQLGQLFQNLLSNATKFVRPEVPPVVRISASPRGKKLWQFSFQDNGIGIEPQYAERIFIIFQRLHGKDAYPGTGIGLAICKKIVERHGGRLWVESKNGAGAKFLFTLPAVDA